MATALWPLQSAVYAALTGSTPLMALITGVFDEVPDGQTYPYVTLGSMVETADDAHDHQGLDSLVTIHVWSKKPGVKEAATIFAALDAVIDRQTLAVAGFSNVQIWQDTHMTVRDPDPLIRHINAQYRVRMTRST